MVWFVLCLFIYLFCWLVLIFVRQFSPSFVFIRCVNWSLSSTMLYFNLLQFTLETWIKTNVHTMESYCLKLISREIIVSGKIYCFVWVMYRQVFTHNSHSLSTKNSRKYRHVLINEGQYFLLDLCIKSNRTLKKKAAETLIILSTLSSSRWKNGRPVPFTPITYNWNNQTLGE